MSAHTPGPWRVRDCVRLGQLVSQDICGPESCHVIAEMYAPHEANARLIAAAPALAEQLRDCIAELESYEQDRAQRDLCERARAALKEAGL